MESHYPGTTRVELPGSTLRAGLRRLGIGEVEKLPESLQNG